MIVKPYSRVRPAPVPVALLDADARAWNEHGDEVPLDDAHPHALYAHADVVRRHLTAGRGRGWWWNSQLIAWEPEPDIGVRVLPDNAAPETFTERLVGLVLYAAWLGDHGVSLAARSAESPPRSLGSASWSLLRARLAGPLWTGSGQRPPIRNVIGGRQEMGWNAPGTYAGPWYLWDISAAYARTLATLPYGGWWRHLTGAAARTMALDTPNPAFVRARVTMPIANSQFVGPLPERPRGHRNYADSLLSPVHYPRTGTIQGTWTAPELLGAIEAGCSVRIIEAWLHFVDSDARPFGPWWSAVAEGRALGRYAGDLGKAMGNALLGQFHIDRGRYTERWWDAGRPHRKVMRPHGRRPPAFDLAEYVCGKVRSRLYREAILPGGAAVLACHTDSAWVRGKEWSPNARPDLSEVRTTGQRTRLGGLDGTGPERRIRMPGADWRLSDAADVIDIIDPQHLAYRRPGEAVTRYKMAGSEPEHQAADFDELWRSVMGQDVQRQTVAFDHVQETARTTRRRKVKA